jgi:hypothetical protein
MSNLETVEELGPRHEEGLRSNECHGWRSRASGNNPRHHRCAPCVWSCVECLAETARAWQIGDECRGVGLACQQKIGP